MVPKPARQQATRYAPPASKTSARCLQQLSGIVVENVVLVCRKAPVTGEKLLQSPRVCQSPLVRCEREVAAK